MAKYIGVMSGTSMDGIDIALCEIDAKNCKLIKSLEYKFDKEIKKEILHYINSKVLLKQLGELDIKLGNMFAEAVCKFIKTNNLDASKIEAIGLHGQTIWHEPDSKYPFSMQLGSADVVNAKTAIKVVADFRMADIARGGEGAPLTPAFHRFVFGSKQKGVAVLNIGGMANITLLGKKLKGWDSGPGNVLMDLWMQKNYKLPYDKKGKVANSGVLNKELLKFMLEDSYFYKEPPKSTGREKFNKKYISSVLSNFKDIKPKDVQRTFLELTARVVAKDLKQNGVKKLIVCGGGSKNKMLLKRIEKLSKVKLSKSDEYNIKSDFLEAMAFAWFAYKRVHNEKIDIKDVTGASKNTLLGAIYG